KYEEEILRLSLDVTQHLDKLYGLSLNELGLDFAIDDTGRIWMHEANNGPQTAYHEEERAIEYIRSEEHTSELRSRFDLVCRLLLNTRSTLFPYTTLFRSKYEEEILRLSLDVTQHLDKLYGLSLNELGLDFAIDDTGRIWMHEANNGPQTAYHEEERAIEYI